MTAQRCQPSMAQRLQDHAASDHERGCMGRQYSCSCEYDATTETLLVEASVRIAELESNEAAYESILGPQTYNEVAEHIRGLEEALNPMRILYDPDEFETVVESRPCTACGGDLSKCNGGCNGMASYGQRRRKPEEIKRIKAERQRQHEDKILAEADAIRARRS